MINRILFTLLGAAFLMTVNAQTESSAYEPEMEGWLVRIEEAYAESQRTGKPIMANFTGSDWCGWCIRLKKAVFVHDEFQEWADENVVLLELDFPRRKKLPADLQKQNRDLQRQFSVRGFPTIWVFDIEKNDAGQYQVSPLGKTGYAKTVGDFTGAVDQMLARRDKS